MSWKNTIRKEDPNFKTDNKGNYQIGMDEFGRDADERGELPTKPTINNNSRRNAMDGFNPTEEKEFKFFLSAIVSSIEDMPERELHALAEKTLQKMVGEMFYDKKGSNATIECEIVSVSENR